MTGGTECRAVAGDCDVAEQCDGSSPTCPTDTFVSAGTVCRAVSTGDLCDEEEQCTGSSAACPADEVLSAGTVCRASAGDCDIEEQCDGSTKQCPTDTFVTAGTVCRAVSIGDLCDEEEQCTGSSAACPPDAVTPAGTECRASAGVCDVAEQCDGTNKQCPPDGFDTGTICRAATSGDLCDADEACDGSGVNCPADDVKAAGTVCRPSADLCDAEEQCNGSSKLCPADVVASAGTVCRPAAGECDVAEECDGSSAACPADGFVTDGTSCTDDGMFCTGTESCQSGVCAGSGDPCGGAYCDEIEGICLSGGCPAGPMACRSAEKSIFLVKNKTPDSKDKLIWKWIKGEKTNQTEFGDPTDHRRLQLVRLCRHDGDAGGRAGSGARRNACGSRSARTSPKGFKYKDKTGTEYGVQKIILKGSDKHKVEGSGEGQGRQPARSAAGERTRCWPSTCR